MVLIGMLVEFQIAINIYNCMRKMYLLNSVLMNRANWKVIFCIFIERNAMLLSDLNILINCFYKY